MVSTEDKKRIKLSESGLDTEKNSELVEFLVKNWPATSQILKNKQSKELFQYMIPEFYSRSWIKNSGDLKKATEINSFLLTIAQKHFGDRDYSLKEVFDFDFLKDVVKGLPEWTVIINILNQSESPFDLFNNGIRALFHEHIIKSSKDLSISSKIAKSAGHNANNIFAFAVPILAKHKVIESIEDLENLLKTLLEICNSVKYPSNIMRDLKPFGEKNLLRNKQDLEMIRDFLKTEKDTWKAQQKFYKILNYVNLGKIRFSFDLKKYMA